MKNIFLLFFFFSGIVVAQNHDNDKVTYLDFNQKPTSKADAVYYEFKTAYKEGILKYQKYYITDTNKALLVEKYYCDLDNKKQGKYKSYFKSGTIKEEGIYQNSKKVGQWKFYNSCKKHDDSIYIALISRVVSYKNGKKHGNFIEYDYLGTVLGEGQYNNDFLIGECIWYYLDDQLHSIETYSENGKLIDIKQWELFGKEKTKRLIPMHDKDSRIEILKNQIQTAVIHNFDIHAFSRPTKYVDRIYLKLLIDKKGKIHTLKAKSSVKVNKIQEDKAKQVIENMSNIEPFYKHNQLTNLKISFYVRVFPRVVKVLN